ncbi:MAG: hypothetical protein CML66_00900 [Rhodobacteraceae bacterium]|nr:hypothetical protein [Paracoccaceae bacterium]MAY46449.1 hypothetical protein [Paracoccaceae bacterium]QEW19179.1 hypothetical protein LA6_001362 [Marinibacterium anthonyi]
MSHTSHTTAFARPAGRRPRIGAFFALWRQRRQLAQLDDRALNDIGISRSEAEREAARLFWDAPAHWRD